MICFFIMVLIGFLSFLLICLLALGALSYLDERQKKSKIFKEYVKDKIAHANFTRNLHPRVSPLLTKYPTPAVPVYMDYVTFPSFKKWKTLEKIEAPLDLDFTNNIELDVDQDYVFTFYFKRSDIKVTQRDFYRYIAFYNDSWRVYISYDLIENTRIKTYLVNNRYFIQGDLEKLEHDLVSLRIANA